jgi:hypothetical protein
MNLTFEPSLLDNFRTKIALIEFLELAFLTFAFWCFGAVNTMSQPGANLGEEISFLVGLQIIALGSWAIYNVYIRVARAAGGTLDVVIWVLASLATASYTFWAWTILDLNRLLMAKLFYKGEAPVEYAWSSKSKHVRKLWEKAQRAESM